ncbi:MAG: DUF6444 domain-containing protein [Euryarchaeota archaeon]|jgi:SMC interacting uncharacterized protein involved in chromosome segregation|nr:DUF6444 domain-containing protein [Euryarchaeota archaeon]
MECSSSDIVSLTSLIHNLEEKNKELEEIIKKQAETILHLQSRIIELEARLGLHSANSNFPPSRDIASPPKPVNLRTKSGKKAGGQKNVKG